MEQARVLLTKEDKFYIVLTYLNSEENPKYKTSFPYLNGDQEEALEAARNFGQNTAKNLHTILEENL